MRFVLPLAAAFGLVCTAASAEEFSRELDLGKGRAKVTFTSIAPDAPPSGPKKYPRVGVAPSVDAQFGSFLTRQLDDSSRVQVTSPTKVQSADLPVGFTFDSVTRSELKAAIDTACRTNQLDYILVMGSQQHTTGMDVTVFIIGLGRMKMRVQQEARLYDCRSKAIVWNQNIIFEGSQGLMSSTLSGNLAGNAIGPDASKAMASIYSDKLISDMGW
jgi:hypothetical protein